MELYFLRHGLAGQYGDPKYKDDSLRPLTPEGIKKLEYAALGMIALDLKFDIILSSPYVRARQTAEIVARAYNVKNNKIILTKKLLPPASLKELMGKIKPLFQQSNSILFVGHEPHLSQLISEILNSKKPLNIDFKKGSLCKVNFEFSPLEETATLAWLITQTQLGLMAKEKQ